MKIDVHLPQLCLAISIGCLLVGYGLGGYWLIVPVIIILLVFWFLTKNLLAAWPASTILLSYVFLAVIGVTLKLSVYLMVLGCASALVYWDLMNFRLDHLITSQSTPDASLEKHHWQSLGIAVLISLLAMLVGANLNVHLSFGVIVLLVLIVMIGLTYGLHSVAKRSR